MTDKTGRWGRASKFRPRPLAWRQAKTAGRRRAVWAGLAGALALAGSALLAVALTAQQHPPALPGDLGAIPAPSSSTPDGVSGPQPARAASTQDLSRSRPVSLAIPAIGVHTSLIELGLNPDRTLQVPPLTQAGVKEAGWYDRGPAPGQSGPAVIAGHVDSYQGPGVFFRLGALRPGEQIEVTRADGTVARFRIDAVDQYSKDKFPTDQVYGPVSYAGLRLITCGGQFDYQTHHYRSNIVVYAVMTSSRRS